MLIKEAISTEEIKKKYDQVTSDHKPSFEEFCDLVDKLSEIDPTYPDNKWTAQFSILFLNGKGTAEQFIKQMYDKSRSSDSLSLEEQFYKKYGEELVKKVFSLLRDESKKYADTVLKWISEGYNETDVITSVNSFERLKEKMSHKNIKLYSSYEEFHDEISNIPVKEVVIEDVDLPLIGTYGNYSIYRIENKSQAVKVGQQIPWEIVQNKLGGNGRWCITWQNHNYYNTYSAENQYFYFIEDESQSWGNFNEYKCAIVHYIKVNNKIERRFVTSLKNEHQPPNITTTPLSGLDDIISSDVKDQPEKLISAASRGTAKQSEVIKFLDEVEQNPNQEEFEFLEELDDVFRFINIKYFNKHLLNYFKNKSDNKSNYILYKIYSKIKSRSNKGNIPLDLFNLLSDERKFELFKFMLKNFSESEFSIVNVRDIPEKYIPYFSDVLYKHGQLPFKYFTEDFLNKIIENDDFHGIYDLDWGLLDQIFEKTHNEDIKYTLLVKYFLYLKKRSIQQLRSTLQGIKDSKNITNETKYKIYTFISGEISLISSIDISYFDESLVDKDLLERVFEKLINSKYLDHIEDFIKVFNKDIVDILLGLASKGYDKDLIIAYLPKEAHKFLSKEDIISAAEGYPYLLISNMDESLITEQIAFDAVVDSGSIRNIFNIKYIPIDIWNKLCENEEFISTIRSIINSYHVKTVLREDQREHPVIKDIIEKLANINYSIYKLSKLFFKLAR